MTLSSEDFFSSNHRYFEPLKYCLTREKSDYAEIGPRLAMTEGTAKKVPTAGFASALLSSSDQSQTSILIVVNRCSASYSGPPQPDPASALRP